MEAPEQVYGVTPPMKTDLPTDAERRTTDALLEELKRQNTFESPADTAKRYMRQVSFRFPPLYGMCFADTLATSGKRCSSL